MRSILLTGVLLYASLFSNAQKQIHTPPNNGPVYDRSIYMKQTAGVKSESRLYPAGFESEASFRKLHTPGGPYDYINPEAEMLDKRDLTTKHFKTNDGKIVTIASAGPVHYQKNGLWHTIVNDIYPDQSAPGFGYANLHNRFQTFYGNSFQGGIKIVTEEGTVLRMMQQTGVRYLNSTFTEISAEPIHKGAVSEVKENAITYTQLHNNISARIEQNAAGYELDYTIPALNDLNIPTSSTYVSFTEGIEVPAGAYSEIAPDNKGLYIKDVTGKILLRYKTPVFYEANDPYNSETRVKGTYHTTRVGNVIYIHVLVPASWLTNPDRQFPVVIDPTVVVTPDVAFAWTFTVEEDSGCDFATDNDSDDNMRVGFDDGTIDNDYYQCYAKYNVSSIPDANCVTSAFVSFYQWNWNNPRNDDNQLDFYFQAYDPFNSDPVAQTCDQNYADIDNTFTVYRQYNVWGNCGGGCTDYDETNNQWKNFPDNVAGRVAACLGQNFVAFSLDKFNNSHPDPGFSPFNCGLCGSGAFGICNSCTPNNDEWLDFRGYSNANRPQLVITHEAPFVAATSISATSTTICSGGSVTLTRVGGTTGTAGAWRWYAGGCGSGGSIGSGDAISVSPASTTTYFLRGENPCGNTACVSVTINVVADPSVSASGATTICTGSSATLTATPSGGTGCSTVSWESSPNGVSAWTSTGLTGNSVSVSPTSTTYYRALFSCSGTGCNPNPAISGVLTITVNTPSTAPTSINATSTTLCAGGSTTLTVNGGSLGTGATWQWYTGSCGGTAAGSGTSITVSPVTTTTYFVRAVNPVPCGGATACAQITITVNQPSVAPTGITGTTTICEGSNTTLSVQGGSLGTGANWVWYSGSCGGALVGTGNSVIVSPAVSTVYFVRAEGPGPCPTTTACASTLVTVNVRSTAPGSITAGSTLICSGQSTNLTVNGGSLGTGGQWRWYSGTCGGTPVGTGTTISVSPTSTTTYFVRAEDPNPCGTITTCAQITINVNQPSVAPTGISGTSTICNGGSTTLTVQGGSLGTGANWAWYSSSCGGTFIGSGSSVTVSPTATTTYFVRAEGPAPCALTTACASLTVTVNQLSTDPSGVSGISTVCEGTSTTLTVVGGSLGTGASWQWYSNNCGGTSVGSGNSITVTPATTTAYFVRAEGICNTTNCAFTTVTVNDTSEPATSIGGTAAVCIGSSTSLSAVGGQLGFGANWQWYTGSCGGTLVGSGTPLTVSPSVTTTYYLRAEGTCNNTVCVPLTVTVNPLPNGSLNGSVTVCAGTDTTITVNFSVGTSPFDIVYTDGTNVFSKAGLNNGDTLQVLPSATTTYSLVQITDANGCVRTSGFGGGATITVSPLPVISNVSVSDVLCNGDNTGSVTLTGSSGVPAYAYSLNNGVSYQSGSTFSGLTAGNYFAFIRDALNCTSAYALNPIVVNEPAVLDFTTVVQKASCDNVFDGNITVNATGGVTPYSYSINGGPSQNGNVLSGLSTGSYVIQVTDFNGCSDTAHVFVDTAYSVTGSLVSQTNVSCFGGLDGALTVQLSGGIPPYSYSINGVQFQPSGTFTGLAAGNYVVTLRDSKGCTDFVNVQITQPGLLQAIVDSVQNILCNGGSTGGIFISVNGGTAPFSYLWSNGATTQDVSGLTAGTYTVAITDANGCATSAGATISQPLPLFLNVASFQNLLCFNDSSGAIDITANGGVPPYAFNWSTGAVTEDVSGLQIGTYGVTVTDANGCVQSLSQTLTQPALLTTTVNSTNIPCAGGAGGSVDLTVNGGTPAYSYLWNNGATTQDLANVSGGNYSVVVYDANGCSTTNNVAVGEPAPLQITSSITNVLCNGAATGSIDVSVTGGTSPYSYAWSNAAATQDINSVTAGTYTITVTDANSCTATASFTITQPAALVLNATVQNVGCAGGANGSVDITVNGGVFPYNFNWSNGVTTEDVNGLSGGTYAVTVTDANGCSITASYNLTEPQPLTSSLSVVNVTCNGAANGSVDLSVNGGTSPYSYFWSNAVLTQDLTNVAGGTYAVIITDANGCSTSNTATVTEPAALAISAAVTNVLCNGAATGAVDVTVTGGTTAYTYLWSNAATTQDLSNVTAGTYTLTVTDANSCTATASVTVTQPVSLVLNATVQNVGCAGGANGSVDITVNGGVFPYSFSWSNSETTEDVNGLSGGTYSVTVTDANGCTITASYTINEPTAITSSIVATNVSCNGASDGAANLNVNGGTPPYNFLWSNFTGAEDVSGLSGGLYYVIITDANGCERKDSVLITEPAPLALSTVITNISCFNANNGAIDLSVTGGTTPYSYAWSNGAITQDLNNLQNGTYVVTVTDANQCTATTSVTIINPSVITANFVVKNPSCFGLADGSVDLIPSGGTPSYSFNWSNGQTTEDLTSVGAGTFIVTITDANGCTRVDSTVVTEPQPLFTSGFLKHITCFGFSDGFIDITAYGGTLPYTYTWSNGSSTEDIGGLPGGQYYVTVADANNCFVASLYIVNEPQLLVADVTGNNVLCNGAATGSVTATVTGGTTPYYYLWNNFETTASLQNVVAGKYTVQVIDSNGCLTYDSLVITEPSPIAISGTVTDAVCFGAATGAVDVSVSGGVPGYSYAWSNSAVTEDLSGITAAVYTITVTDANNCSAAEAFTVEQGDEIVPGIAALNPICNGGSTGSLTAIVTGGDAPYSYTWSNASTTIAVGGLKAGTYTLTVTDSKSCSVSASATLTEPAPVSVTATSVGSKCFNTTDGKVITGVTGGTAPYTYLLNGVAQSTDTFVNLLPGDYLVLVTDVNGCQGTANFTISSPAAISVDLTATEQEILTGMQTQLIATPSDSVSIIGYTWSPVDVVNFDNCADPANCPNPFVTPFTTTTFTVFAMSADSCIVSDTFTVVVIRETAAFIPTAFTPNNDKLNDRFEFDILGATAIEVAVFNRWGQRVYYNANQTNGITNADGWDGTVNGKEAPSDTYTYQINVKYFDNVEKSFSGTISLMR